jgi:hypothetical protein
MWALFEKAHSAKRWQDDELTLGLETMLVPVLQEDYDNFYADQSFLEDFPLPRFTGSLLQPKYDSWEEYKQGKDPVDIPLEQPFTWNPIDDMLNTFTNAFTQTPLSGYVTSSLFCSKAVLIFRAILRWGCDKCEKVQGPERSLRCLECPGLFPTVLYFHVNLTTLDRF